MDPDVGWADLGVRLVLDPKSKGRIDSEATGAMRQAGTSSGTAFGREAGDRATSELTASIKDWSKKGAVALGGGLGFALGYGIREGIGREQVGDVVAASLGLTAKQQQQQGKIAGSLYAKAFGDSYEEVAQGVAAVTSSLPDLDGNGQIRRASADALNFAKVFGVDVPRNVQVARTIISAGLAKDADRAFDLMTRASQRVPQNVREDVLDAAEEYSQFFKTLGFDGQQAFSLLVANAGEGQYGIDKAGDAIKEFTIRATDGSKATGLALESIGLNAGKMSNDLLAGGDTAQAATQKIIAGLLDIEDPTQRATTAITLFGTPIEDLNVGKIPAFLRSLQGTKGGLDDVEGAADRMGKKLSGNVSTDITKVKRKLETDLVNFLSEKGLPAVESFSDWMEEDGVPMLKDVAKFGGRAADAVGDMVGFLNDLPDPAKYAGLAALVTGVAGVKLRGGKSGLLGSAGAALGITKPIPVLVTNPGFGGPGVDIPGGGKPGGGKVGKGALAGLLTNPLTWFATQAAVGTQWSNQHLAGTAGSDAAVSMAGPQSQGGGGGLGAPPGFFNFDEDEEQKERDAAASERRTQALRDFFTAGDIATQTSKELGIETDANVGKFEAFWRTTGKTKTRVDRLNESMDLLGGVKATPSVELDGYDRAMSQVATLAASMAALPGPGALAVLPGLAVGAAGTSTRRHGHGGARRP